MHPYRPYGGEKTMPRPTEAQDSPLRLSYGQNVHQSGELYLPTGPGPHPVALLLHGGYWRARYGLELMRTLGQDLAGRGIAAWNIEYRRVGNPGGGWPGTFLDVAQAADTLRDLAPGHNLDLRRVVPIGHSAGGHLAFWLAARRCIPAGSSIGPRQEPLALAGAISLAGVVDLALAYRLHLSNDAVVELLGAAPDEAPARYAQASPAAMLPLGLPQVLIHGTPDEHVPVQVSREYATAARAAGDPLIFLELAGVDHFTVIRPGTAVWTLTVQHLERLFTQAG
jgi:acetyl esterase/lipase